MTEIKIRTECKNKSQIIRCTFEIKGHCDHDVCVSVSALVSTLVQIVKEEYGYSNVVKEPEIIYERGYVKIIADFYKVPYYKKIRYKIEAIETGLSLFESNYPNEITLI